MPRGKNHRVRRYRPAVGQPESRHATPCGCRHEFDPSHALTKTKLYPNGFETLAQRRDHLRQPIAAHVRTGVDDDPLWRAVRGENGQDLADVAALVRAR